MSSRSGLETASCDSHGRVRLCVSGIPGVLARRGVADRIPGPIAARPLDQIQRQADADGQLAAEIGVPHYAPGSFDYYPRAHGRLIGLAGDPVTVPIRAIDIDADNVEVGLDQVATIDTASAPCKARNSALFVRSFYAPNGRALDRAPASAERTLAAQRPLRPRLDYRLQNR
jgi:hypothetical protein